MKTSLEKIEIDIKRLEDSISDIESKIESILCSKLPDRIEVAKLIQHKADAYKLLLEMDSQRKIEKKKSQVNVPDDDKIKNDNYDFVRGSYVKAIDN